MSQDDVLVGQNPRASAADAASYGRNIRRIYAYQALTNASLWMPIWIIFLQTDRDLTLSQIYLIAGIGWVVQAVADVPLGVFADTFGRKFTVVSGTVLLTLGMAGLAVLPGVVGVGTGYLLWAVGTAMMSGTDNAMLYESARLAGRENEFPKIASHSFQIIQASQALGAIAGSLLASLALSLPMLITAALTAIAVGFIASVREPALSDDSRVGYAEMMRQSTRYLGSHPPVLRLVGYMAVLSGTAFFVPFVLFQPQMQSYAVPVGWLGILFTGLRLSALVGSRYGYRLISVKTLGAWLTWVPIVVAALFVGVAASPTWWSAYAAMLLIAMASASIRPHTADMLNRMVASRIRATLLSFQSLVMTIFIALMHPAVGGVTDAWSLNAAFLLLALLSLLPLIARAYMDPTATYAEEEDENPATPDRGKAEGRVKAEAGVKVASEDG